MARIHSNYNSITAKLIHEKEWDKTQLGAMDNWPDALKHMVRCAMASPLPMCIAWGQNYIRIYNDQYIPLLGQQHPSSLGKPIAESSPALWDQFEPIFKNVMDGEIVSLKDLKLNLNKAGFWEEAYLDLNLSPILIDDKNIGGVLVVASESTDKVRAEQALKNSEKRFRDLITNAPVAISVFRGPDFICEVANKMYLPLIYKTEEEFVGKPLFEALPEAKELIPVANNLLATGEPFVATEYPLILNKHGKMETCYFTAIWEPVREAEGKIDGFMAVVTEVTHQVEARKKIEASETRLKNLVSQSTVPTAVFYGTNMVLQMVNDAMLSFWDLEGKEIIGKALTEFMPEMIDQPFPKLLQNVYETGETYIAVETFVFLRTRGNIYCDFSYKAMRNEEGQIDSILVQATDVTEKVLSKQKLIHSKESLKNTILKAPVAMCILRGREFVVEIANERMIELWGTTEKKVIDKPLFEGLPEVKNQGFEDLLAGVYTTGIAFIANGAPVNLPREKGVETAYVNFVYEALKESDDTITGIIVVATDVTSQVEARQQIEHEVNERTKELAKANQQLKKSNAELAQFAYIASHDLQEPLRKIKTFTHFLNEALLDRLSPQEKQFIEKINNSTTRMTALVRDVLVYSQVVNEKDLFEQVDLNETLKGILEDFELLIEQKQAKITIEDLPVISAIPLQMTQLFGNLIGNALKFTRPDTTPKIEITVSETSLEDEKTARLELPGKYYKIKIKDNGIGFKQEHSEQIFNIFQRLHNKSEYEGTGIGLALCKKIVYHHNGDIYASETGETGAVFYILLPVISSKA